VKNSTTSRSVFLSRMALFIVFVWFGFLKVIGMSPAEELVGRLFDETLSFALAKNQFIVAFGFFEMALGTLWLFGKYTKIAFVLLCIHMFCTFLPMVLLLDATWQSFMVLTLVGQYIVKNLVLLASAYFIFEQWQSLRKPLVEPRNASESIGRELVLD
jgi:uncharacterized membrane protein YkgB